MRVYTNVFEGYSTRFVINDQSRNTPDISHKCVITFDNTPRIEIVIPYLHNLEPCQMKRDLELLLERVEEIPDEEYPYRLIRVNEEQSSLYKATESIEPHSEVYVYWHPIDSRVRVRVLSFGIDYISALQSGIGYHQENLHKVKDNIQNLLRTMKY